MKNYEENIIFDFQEEMEIEEINNTMEIIGDPIHFINNNQTIYFGFYEKSTNIFYKIIEIKSKYFKINRKSKELEIKYKINEHTRYLFYNLLDNNPTLIRENKKKSLNNNNLEYDFDTENIIIHFTYSPTHRKKREHYNDPSSYLMDNYNLENNLLCFNCPYKTFFIPNCSKYDLEQIYNQLFFHEKREIITETNIKILTFEDYKNKIVELKEKINFENNNSFNDIYASYANISENIDRFELETIISIYNNFKYYFKIEKNEQEKKTDKNKNEIYVMKRIVITPYFVKIKKENLHPSSRFLRLYYNNNNFLKIEFQDEKESQLFSHNGIIYLKSTNSGYSKLYSKIFNEGFNLCGKKYLFFLSPTNCMRSNCLWVLEENEYKEKLTFYYKNLGVYSALADKSIKFSKAISRIGQNFTSTIAFYHKNKNISFDVTVIEDLRAPNGEIYNDGCGLISLDLMKLICKDLNKNKFSSAIQIRFKGAKGVLVINPKIEGRKIILTKSMMKYEVNNSDNIEICRFAKYSTGFLNLQIIILLILNGVKKNKIFNFAKKEMMNYRNYKKYKNKDKILVENNDINKILKLIEKQDKNLQLEKDYMSKIARSAYIYNRLSSISKKYRFHLKNCCFLFGVCDFFGVLEKNEIYVQIHKENGNKKIITGEVLLTKNPCLSVYDIQKVKAVNNDKINNYFYEFYENVVVFPSKGEIPLPSKISGSDLDGDIYWVCWEQSFVKQFKKKDYSYKSYLVKNNDEINFENEYTINEKGEKIRKTYIKINTKDFNKKKCIINNSIKSDIESALNNNESMDKINLEIKNICLNFYKFYQIHYKLPEVSKSHLSLAYKLFTNNLYEDGCLIDELERHAFYHSMEVDFQKTGETSDFSSTKGAPTFLTKTAQYRLSNNLIKLKEIYDEYINISKQKFQNNNITDTITNYDNFDDNSSTMSGISIPKDNNERNCPFYDFFIERGKYQENEMNSKNLKLYNKQKIISDKKNLSFIYQLYELVSFYPAMQESFLTSIYLMTDEFFYKNKIKEKIFKFSNKLIYNENIFKEITKKIININTKYENEIKYIMKDNCISIEIELIYFNEFLEPKKEVFKHDVEDYRKNLFESINLVQKNSIKNLEIIRKEYFLKLEDIKNILFIILFWVPREEINIICDEDENKKNIINLIDILKDAHKRIDSVKFFIEDIVEKNTLVDMNNFFYDNIKCISLYYYYTSFSESYVDN